MDLAFHDHATRRAWAAAQPRLRLAGHALIAVRVNDDRAAVCVEERQRPVTKRHAVGGRFNRRLAARVRHEVRQIAHVERVIRIRIHRAARAWIEVTTGGGECRSLALSNGMQMQSMRARLETGHRHGDLDGFHAGHELHVVRAGHRVHFAQLGGTADVVALDVGVRAHALWRRRGNGDGHHRGSGGGQNTSGNVSA